MLILNCAVIITNVVIPNIKHTEQHHLGSEPRSKRDIGLCCLVYEWEYNESLRMRERVDVWVGGGILLLTFKCHFTICFVFYLMNYYNYVLMKQALPPLPTYPLHFLLSMYFLHPQKLMLQFIVCNVIKVNATKLHICLHTLESCMQAM